MSPVLVNTSVIARIGLDKMEGISPEQAVDEALTALVEKRASTLPRANMSEAFEDMKDALVDMVKARLRGGPARAPTALPVASSPRAWSRLLAR
jgi:hypothetical protein